MKFLWIILILILVAGGVAYAFYRQWPAAMWARRVRNRVRELTSRRDILVNPPRTERSPAEMLADELFTRQKRNVSINALAEYKGIGPKTIEALQDANIRTFDDAEQHAEAFLFKKKVQSLGPVREQALADAVKELRRDERKRFDDARSPEGQEYRTRLATLGDEEKRKAEAKQREVAALETCLNETRPLLHVANDVSMLSWLFGQGVPGLADAMAKTLPDVVIAEPPPPPIAKRVPETVEPPASWYSEKPEPPPAQVPPVAPASPKLEELRAYTRFGLLVAKADGRVAAAERGRIRVILGERFGSDPVLLRHLDPQLEAAEKETLDEAQILDALKDVDRAELVDFARRVAEASGGIGEREQALIDRLDVGHVSYVPEKPGALETCPTLDPRVVLGIPEGVEITPELVRRKYNLLWAQVCPEKASALGPEFAAMAEQKRKAIQAAAEALLNGEPLEVPVPPPSDKLRENSDLDDLFGSLQSR